MVFEPFPFLNIFSFSIYFDVPQSVIKGLHVILLWIFHFRVAIFEFITKPMKRYYTEIVHIFVNVHNVKVIYNLLAYLRCRFCFENKLLDDDLQ